MKLFSWIIDPKDNKPSVSLTFATAGFIISSTILVLAIILSITTKIIDASMIISLGATIVTYMSACFVLYFGRRKNNISQDLKDVLNSLNGVKKELNQTEKENNNEETS